MIINREILNQHTTHKYTVERVMAKARHFQIIFDKMARTSNGAIYPTVHFKKADWIEAQKIHIATMRIDAVATNTQLLEFVEGVTI